MAEADPPKVATPSNGEATPWNANCRVFSTRATTALLRILRDKRTGQRVYAEAADRLCRVLAEEALASIAEEPAPLPVETPCGVALMAGGRHVRDESSICLVDIMRSGAILMDAVRHLAPSAKTAKILIQRDEATALPELLYSKLPPRVEEHDVLLCDPMLATGGSAVAAIDVLKAAGVPEGRILFANVLTCPEGLQRLAADAPGVRIITCAIDEKLDERKYIVPGLGDFGDRYYGTAGYDEGYWGTAA